MNPGHLNMDTAAKLIGVTPDELDKLGRSGAIQRVGREAYPLVTLVRDYIAYVRSEDARMNTHPSQQELAEHLDLSERSIRALLAELNLDHKQTTRDEIRIAYIRKLREQAAGRATQGDLNLADERAGLAREQKLLARIRKQRELGEWAPIDNLSLVLSKVCSQIASTFDSLPVRLKRSFPAMPADQLNLIREELAGCRNLLVSTGAEAIRSAAISAVDYVDEFDDVAAAEE